MSLLSQTVLLYSGIKKYFDENPKSVKRVLPIINGQSHISIRVIDWFVTNYSKKNNVSFNIPNKQEPFIVWLEYKAQLKGWSKKLFDPFCRNERIKYTNKDTELISTVGQLNFFKWAIDSGVIDYVETNLKDIEKDMLECCKYSKNESNTRRKRRELSISAIKTVSKQNIKITLKFD